MNITKSLATVATAGVLSIGMVAPASAAPNANNQSGGVAGLVAAVVNANVQDVQVRVVETGDINVRLQNILNNNRVLTDFLNNNDIDVNDVIDITVEGNDIIVTVLGATNAA